MRRGSLPVLLAVVTLATEVIAQPPVSFSRDPGDYVVGSSPLSVTAADFSGDLIPDLATANTDSDDVWLLRGNGDGTFSDIGAIFEVGLTPVAVGSGDFTGDGRLDIITANEIDNTVSVLPNEGSSVFGTAIDSETGTSPEALFIGRFDADQALDVATTDNFDDTVTILKGVGDGTFTILDVVLVGIAPVGMAGGDLNNDDKVDLVVANSGGGPEASGSISVLKGLDEGRFEALEEIPVTCGSEGCAPVAVAIADFNADDNLDVAVLNEEADSVSILLGNGDLTFEEKGFFLVGSFPEGIVVGDFNDDGKADVATTSNFQDNVVVLVGVGDGTFLPQPASVLAQDAAQGAMALVLENASRFPSFGTALVDTEILEFTSRSGNTLNLAAPLSATVSAQTVVSMIFPVGAGPWGIASGDFNRDDKVDLVTANQDDETVSILLNVSGPISTCAGDCDDTGAVTIDDIIRMVNIAQMTAPIADCLAGDVDGDGTITVDEIIQAVNNAQNGCPMGAGDN